MGCETIPCGDGFAIVCSRGGRRKPCSECKARPSTKLCDYALTGSKAGKTCDRSLCERCAVKVGTKGRDTIDYCPAHARHAELAASANPDGVIVHVFADYPRKLGTRCGLPVHFKGFGVPEKTAEREDWGGSVRGLALCFGCARRPGRRPLPKDSEFRPPTIERKDPTT